MIKHTPVPTNFLYPDITPNDYRFGSNQVTGTILREDGNWIDYVPNSEDQNKYGVEAADCYIEAQQHAIATLQEEQYDFPNQDYSGRFNAYMSDGTQYGGNPLSGSESIRKDGLVSEMTLPFNEEIKSWNEYHNLSDSDKSKGIKEGQEWLKKWEPLYDIVFTRDESVTQKYAKLKEALKYSPICLSVLGWYQDSNGLYIKPEGTNDNHFVECVWIDEEGYPYIWDTYPPYLKKLDKTYNFDFALRWTLEKKSIVSITLWDRIISICKWFFREKLVYREFKKFLNNYYKNK